MCSELRDVRIGLYFYVVGATHVIIINDPACGPLLLQQTFVVLLLRDHCVSLSRRRATVTARWRPEHLGIQHGSGGRERVIGLRSAVLAPDWPAKCEKAEHERRESADAPAAHALRSPPLPQLTVPALLRTEM